MRIGGGGIITYDGTLAVHDVRTTRSAIAGSLVDHLAGGRGLGVLDVGNFLDGRSHCCVWLFGVVGLFEGK